MRTDRVARSSLTTGQGARHCGASLAPVTDQSLMAGAACASSLPAGAVVVTTRLAQRCWRRTLLAETDTAAGAVEQGCHTRMRAKSDCARATLDDCGTMALVAWTFTAAYLYLLASRLPVFRR